MRSLRSDYFALIKFVALPLLVSTSFSPCALASQNEDESSGLLAEANLKAAHYSYAAAEELYKKYLAAKPESAFAHHMYGRLLALLSRYDDAVNQYRLSLKLKPGDPSVLNDVGVVLSINNWQSLGARFLNQAVVALPNYPAALNNRGVVLSSLGAFRQARDSFAKSLEIQPRNAKIKDLKAKAELSLAESVPFDYGVPVSWSDLPSTLKRAAPAVVKPAGDTASKDVKEKTPVVVEASVKKISDDDKSWLEKAQPLFLELKTSGFTNITLAGNGIVQVGDKSDTADNIGQLDLNPSTKIEIMGDVTVDFTGEGELLIGKSKVESKSDDCIFSISPDSCELYAGRFLVSEWASVSASRSTAKVDFEASGCQSVYVQDDSKISASDCGDVTLVGHCQGMLSNCKKVVVNDDSRAVAKNCDELTALANARVRSEGCKKIEKLDNAKVEKAD